MSERKRRPAVDEERVVTLLYVIMRDRMPTGDVAKIMYDYMAKAGSQAVTFTNRHLEAYARDLVDRFMRKRAR